MAMLNVSSNQGALTADDLLLLGKAVECPHLTDEGLGSSSASLLQEHRAPMTRRCCFQAPAFTQHGISTPMSGYVWANSDWLVPGPVAPKKEG